MRHVKAPQRSHHHVKGLSCGVQQHTDTVGGEEELQESLRSGLGSMTHSAEFRCEDEADVLVVAVTHADAREEGPSLPDTIAHTSAEDHRRAEANVSCRLHDADGAREDVRRCAAGRPQHRHVPLQPPLAGARLLPGADARHVQTTT